MPKLDSTKYETEEWGEITAKAIIDKLKRRKEMKYSRKLRCYYASIVAKRGGYKFRLFVVRNGRKGKWRVLLTTDTSLEFLKAYEIYAIRWSIEVFFADSKRLLDLS